MATGDNPAGWKINNAGADHLEAPEGKTFVSAVDGGLFVEIRVRMASVLALPAYTYANGSSGVGATMTYNANGAAADIDGLTPALGDLLHHQTGPNAFENGTYKLTQVGTGGTPAIWTRSTMADTSAKILGSKVHVTQGAQGKGIYQFATAAAVTIGTDALFWYRVSAEEWLGETIVLIDDDFIMATVAANGTSFGRNGVAPSYSGTSAIVSLPAAVASATRVGVMQLALGTTTTGRCAITHNATGTNDGGRVLVATNAALFMQGKLQMTKLSDGTDTYQWFFGLADNIAAMPAANCIGFIYTQATTTFWRAITSNASTTTITNSAATVTATVDDVLTIIKDAGTNAIRFYVNGVLAATISTNVPTGNPIGFVCGGLKSAGTNAGSNAQLDYALAKLTLPARRAA